MPPKIKITKEKIIEAAVAAVRSGGEAALNARSIAADLGCSTQPIFSNFSSMDELRLKVIEKAEHMHTDMIEEEIGSAKYPPYKASGMAYIRFAAEEKELFKLLYMRDRSEEVIPTETDLQNSMESLVHDNTGLDGHDMKLFHLEMWAFVHGVATMLATGYLKLDTEIISKMLTDAYQGLKKHYEGGVL